MIILNKLFTTVATLSLTQTPVYTPVSTYNLGQHTSNSDTQINQMKGGLLDIISGKDANNGYYLQIQSGTDHPWINIDSNGSYSINVKDYNDDKTVAVVGVSRPYTNFQEASKNARNEGSKQLAAYIFQGVTAYTKDKTFTQASTDEPISSQVVAAEISEYIVDEMVSSGRAQESFCQPVTMNGKQGTICAVLYVASRQMLERSWNKAIAEAKEDYNGF